MPAAGQAAVFVGPGAPLEIREYPIVEPSPSVARLRLAVSGICGTDVHIAEGRLAIPPSFIPGHEFVGTVEALGDGAETDALGTPVGVGEIAIACAAVPCGKCFTCRQGATASCLQFGVTFTQDPSSPPHFFGGYADYLFSPAANLVVVPKEVDLDAVSAFPCAGPTIVRACAYAGGPAEGELVVVQGTGPVGLFAVAWAAASGCRVVAIGSGSSPARMDLAKRLGASEVWDYRRMPKEDRLAAVQALASDLGRGDGADVVVEASGSPAAFAEGIELTRTLGRYIVPGQYSASGAVEVQPQMITFKALTIAGSGQYTIADVGEYLSFLRNHTDLQRPLASSITHRYRVADANEALANASAGVSIKGVFVP